MENDTRFSGFSDVYDKGRPCLPDTLFEYIHKFYMPRIEVIADIGCGTGLSTVTCSRYAEQVYAIDLSEDMIKIAIRKEIPRTKFWLGRGEETGIISGSVDIALFCQNFHWMDIERTMRECGRILKNTGLILIVDYSYMPQIGQEIEKIAYQFQREICTRDKAEKLFYHKKKDYGELLAKFATEYEIREYYFTHSENYTFERFFDFILSKSSIQNTINDKRLDRNELYSRLYSDLKIAFQNIEKEAVFQYRAYICNRKEAANARIS